MAEKHLMVVIIEYICPCCGYFFDAKVQVPQVCPDCEVKREGVLDQAEPGIATKLEDPAELGWQEAHSKGAKEVRDG